MYRITRVRCRWHAEASGLTPQMPGEPSCTPSKEKLDMARKQPVARTQSRAKRGKQEADSGTGTNGHDDEVASYEEELAGYLQERIRPGLNRGAIPLLARSIAKEIAHREHPNGASEDAEVEAEQSAEAEDQRSTEAENEPAEDDTQAEHDEEADDDEPAETDDELA